MISLNCVGLKQYHNWHKNILSDLTKKEKYKFQILIHRFKGIKYNNNVFDIICFQHILFVISRFGWLGINEL